MKNKRERKLKIILIVLIVFAVIETACNLMYINEMKNVQNNMSIELEKTKERICDYKAEIKSKDESIENLRKDKAKRYMNLSDEDKKVLLKITMAEAGNQPVEGKAMVMRVVLNRVENERFDDTIQKVVFKKGQFTPVSNGVYEKAVPNKECYEALGMIEAGWDMSENALYFSSEDGGWHDTSLDFIFKIGGHKFYK